MENAHGKLTGRPKNHAKLQAFFEKRGIEFISHEVRYNHAAHWRKIDKKIAEEEAKRLAEFDGEEDPAKEEGSPAG